LEGRAPSRPQTERLGRSLALPRKEPCQTSSAGPLVNLEMRVLDKARFSLFCHAERKRSISFFLSC